MSSLNTAIRLVNQVDRDDLAQTGILPIEERATSDLALLSTAKAMRFARSLREVLDRVGFDSLNADIRCDYTYAPLPYASAQRINEDLERLSPKHLTRIESALVKCFLLGEEVEREKLESALGVGGRDLLKTGAELGVFRQGVSGTALNNLLLCSHKLCDGQVIYCFADIPPYMKSAGTNLQRVYLGADSYYLNAKLQTLSDLQGTIVEYGSGSGIQLITLLKMHEQVTAAFGVEIDARARNVSSFNAAFNGVAERFHLLENLSHLSSALGASAIALAISNPPFIAAPKQVLVPGLDAAVDIAEIFSKAGWGGEDGMLHTRRFLSAVAPHLTPDSQAIIYAQFGGSNEGPEVAVQTLSELPFAAAVFQHFPHEEHALCSDLTAGQCAKYLVGALETEHPGISSRVTAALESTAIELFNRQGVEKFHSGFLVLGAGHTSSICHGDLRQAESALSLWTAGGPSPSILVQILDVLGDRVSPPPGIGGQKYSPPKLRLKSLGDLDSVFLKRPLSGDYELEAGQKGGQYRYRVLKSQTGKEVEAGSVYNSSGNLSSRYRTILGSIVTAPSDTILRNYSEGRWCRALPMMSLESVIKGIGTDRTECVIDFIPITNSFEVRSCSGEARTGKPVVTGSLTSPLILPLLKAVKENFPDAPCF